MAENTIYKKESIDPKTGKPRIDVKVTASKNNETFTQLRTTNLDWLKKFKKIQDIQLLIFMVEFEDKKTGKIVFTPTHIQMGADFFDVDQKTIRNSISSLIGLGFLKRIPKIKHNYIVNPMTFYKGGIVSMVKKMHHWEQLKLKELQEKEII